MINKRSDELKEIFSNMEKTQESVQLIPMLLALILNDWVFEKYGYEEEDFMKNVGEQAIQTNPGLIQLFREMELAIIKLMQKLEIIPEDVGKYMEQTAQQRGQAPQQLPQQMPNMGMMPGSNPMDLLQMQQMQQMQQMFQNMNMNNKWGRWWIVFYLLYHGFWSDEIKVWDCDLGKYKSWLRLNFSRALWRVFAFARSGGAE